ARPDPPGLLSFNPLLPWSYPTLHPLPFTTPGLLLKSATKHAIDSLCVITPRGKIPGPLSLALPFSAFSYHITHLLTHCISNAQLLLDILVCCRGSP
ncbi:hypothetical protein N7541_010505, partial [Penicillium brevicompactum]